MDGQSENMMPPVSSSYSKFEGVKTWQPSLNTSLVAIAIFCEAFHFFVHFLGPFDPSAPFHFVGHVGRENLHQPTFIHKYFYSGTFSESFVIFPGMTSSFIRMPNFSFLPT